MQTNKTLNYIITIVFIVVTILFINYQGILNISFQIQQWVTLLILFMLIHFFKFLRIYFILLEEKVHSKDILSIYIKTTFTSIILPYKIGEIFKMYEYGYISKNYEKGIITVLIDKFFDALLLCAILVPYGIIKHKQLSKIILLMLLFIAAILVIFYTFEATYKYLNKFFIINKKGKKSLFVLSILKKLNNIYQSAKNMVKGRIVLLLAFTSISWLIEALFISIIARYIGNNVNLTIITDYINAAFFGQENIFVNNYMYVGTIMFLIAIAIMFMKKLIFNKEKII